MSKSKYNSPFSVGKRQTLYLDADDPRVVGFEAGISAARAGAEIVIVNPGNAGLLSGSAASASPRKSPSSPSVPKASEGKTPTDITNLSAEWQSISGEPALVFSFDIDLTSPDNDDVDAFIYTLNNGSDITPPISFTKLNKTSDAQQIIFYYSDNIKFFGIFQTTFTQFKVRCRDKSGNLGPEATLSVIPVYENDLPAPSITVTSIAQGYSVDWNPITEIYNYISIEEVVSNASTDPGTGYEQTYLDSIKPAVITTTNLNARWVRARFTDKAGTYGPYSTAYKITPTSPVNIDNVAPDAPASGSVTAGIDYDPTSQEVVGFNAYIDISWSAVNDNTLKGYRIRFRDNASSGPYTYVDSPGTGTTYRLTGLSIGTTYQIAIASYDEFNNTSSAYTSLGTAVATGTPFIGKNVTTSGYFEAFPGGGSTANSFRFGYGVESGKRGLKFNSNNYWYIDSSASATFKLGGDTNNYISWDGGTFIVQGDIRARSGNFQGNVTIMPGGSLASGTYGQLTGNAGYILNTSGLRFDYGSTQGITLINAMTGKLTTSSAEIGGWDVTSSTITKTSGSGVVTLDSANAQIRLTSVNYTAGIATPNTNSTSDIVFWAGGARSTAASFYVTANGILNANSANLQGKLSTAVSGNAMKFGTSVGDNGEDGIHLNSANYWYVDDGTDAGAFSFAGILRGTADSVTIDLYNGNGNFFFAQMPSSDDDNWSGDPTITISPVTGKISKGRRIIYDSSLSPTEVPDPVTLTGGEGIYAHPSGNRTVKVGDLILVEENA